MSVNLVRVSAGDDCGWTLADGKAKREAFLRHAYRCDPLVAANRSCLEIVLADDIEINWNGGSTLSDLKVLAGKAESRFGLGTITMLQPYIWKTTDQSWLLLGGQPNPEQCEWRMMDALISTEDLNYPWFPSIRFFRPGIHKIAAGTVVGSVRSVCAGSNPPTYKFKAADEPLRKRHRDLAEHRDQDGHRQLWFYRQSLRRRLSLTAHGEYSNILVGKGWLGRKPCDRLISDFEHNDTDWGIADVWRLDCAKYPELGEAISDAGSAIQRLIGIPVRSVNVHGVRWKPGDSMPLHSDYGARDEFPNRHWTTVIYLNNAEGGKLLLPEMQISPAAGQMISLPGGTMQHGVSKVLETRYTVVMWWQV